MKKVNGIDATAVITARYGPDSGITARKLCDIASTMPVLLRMPVKMPAAKISDTTDSTLPAWLTTRRRCSARFG